MSRQLIKKVSLISALSVSLFMSMSTQTFAADGAGLYAEKGCGSCHGADGNTPIMGAPKIGGQNKDYLIQLLKSMKSGARSNGRSVMKRIMVAVSDEDISAISEYLASLK